MLYYNVKVLNHVLFEIFNIHNSTNIGEKIARFIKMVQVCSQKCRRMITYSQIWLTLPKDDHHFGYKQKLLFKKKSLP
jgi:hypothetical protein